MQTFVLTVAALLSAAAAAPLPPPVGITRAQTAALRKAPGELVDTRLALDHGRLVYDVAIESAPTTRTDVLVDAASGRVLRATAHLDPGPVSHEMEAP